MYDVDVRRHANFDSKNGNIETETDASLHFDLTFGQSLSIVGIDPSSGSTRDKTHEQP